jgi:2-polyprenyl-3-methyl-5-hydroxy-6-metoxy-1,4-benzoquinol methylase
MSNNNYNNKQYWDNFNSKYSGNWKSAAKEELSKRELSFVNKYLSRDAKNILDIGVGNGRIMQNIIDKSGDKAEIYGIDISEKMVEICRQKFNNEIKVKAIKICDASAPAGICFDKIFDFVSAVRIVKYNKDWVKMIENVYSKLAPGGVLVFSMLNINSLSRFADYGVAVYQISKKDISALLKNTAFEILEISSVSKLPAFLYHVDNRLYSKLLIGLEKFLEVILGKSLWGKEFFIAVKK